MSKLTFGCDPEVFAVDNKNLVISPALLEIFSGINPVIDNVKHPVYIKQDDFSWMQDGVAFESTYHKIFSDPDEMFETIQESLRVLDEFLSDIKINGKNISLYRKPVVKINPKSYLPMLDIEKVYQGFIFGCDRDWDAIISGYRCETADVTSHLYRYGGGHFHIGSKDLDETNLIKKNIIRFVQLLAIYVGNVCIKNTEFPEEEKIRGLQYGKPGRYRPQPWGVEYRTPSNSWIGNYQTISEMIKSANCAFEILKDKELSGKVIDENLEDTIIAIKLADGGLSAQILSELEDDGLL